MPKKTRGEYIAEFTNAIIKFEKEYLGRGPLEAKTFFVDDMILIRLRGVLTPAEIKLAETAEGMALVKQSRRELFEVSQPLLQDIVHSILGCELISMHTDMSTQTGERVIILTIDTTLDDLFP